MSFVTTEADSFVTTESDLFVVTEGAGLFYQLKVVDRFGVVQTTFQVGDRQMASIESVTWALNEPGRCVFTLPANLAEAADVNKFDEIQVWRNGSMIWWGVAVQRDYNGGAITWTCAGLLWYFTQLLFGPISIEHLVNPEFTTDLSGWRAVGCTATHATSPRIKGPGSARLVATNSGDNYLEQILLVDTDIIGLLITFAFRYWIDPNVPFIAPAFEERGVYVHATNGAPEGNWEPVSMNSPVGEVVPVQTGVQLAPNLTDEVVTVRLYAPHGAIHWAAGSGTEQESVSNNPFGGDVTAMMKKIVEYAQTGRGKFNLNIGTNCPPSGVTEVKTYQFYDLGNIFDALLTYAERNLADFKVVCTSTTRTFTTYAPRKGVATAYTATVPGPGVLTMAEQIDGHQAKSEVVWRGVGEGSSRPLGVARDTSDLGGLLLQSVADAPLEINVDGLDNYAEADLARLKDSVQIFEPELPAEGFIGVVEEGDTITLNVNWGAVQIPGLVRRVVAYTLHPKTDKVVPTLNLPAVPATSSAGLPGAPTTVTATAIAGSKVTVAWTTPASDGGSPITSYLVWVYRDDNSALIWGPASKPTSPMTTSPLTTGVAVYCKVAAVNAMGTGTVSAASNVVTVT